jgi:hypothetical protein
MSTQQIRRRVSAQGYRVGAAVVSVVALAGALGAPIKWG